ncbi:two-component system NtrC family sensor kinase [Oxalobacteraceae bacterium GrIS 1.11]
MAVSDQDPPSDAHQGRALVGALRSIMASTARARGDDFLRTLVRELAAALAVSYVIAGRVVALDDGADGIRTLALWGGNAYLPNLECRLPQGLEQDGPGMCFHASGVQAAYPGHALLRQFGADAYIGMPLIDTEGKTVGILAAIDGKPIDEDKRRLACALLSVFAARGCAELQYQDRVALLECELGQRGEALRAARASLIEQEKLAALGALAAGVAHEVNTPIGVAVTAASGMSAYAGRLLEMVGGEKVSRSELLELAERLRVGAGLVEQNLARAAELIGNFKQLAVDQSSAHISEMGLLNYVQSVVSAHSPELRKAGIKVALRIPALITVELEAGKMSQILSNLLMNSVRHAYPDGGPGLIVIEARIDNSDPAAVRLLLDFTDDGIGLAPEVRERVFEPFFTTKRGRGGSGLGMHVLHTIVQQLGGQVALDGGVARGCRVQIRLPLRRPV